MSAFRRAATARVIAKTLALCLIVVLGALASAALLVQTTWGKDRLRALIVAQAGRFVAGTLEIGRLNGSLFGGIELHDVRFSQDGQTIVAAETLMVSYSLQELFASDLIVREIRVVRPRVVAARDSEGRWNLARFLERREATSPLPPPGLVRPFRLDRITVVDAEIAIESPLVFGVLHIPASFTALDGTFSVARLDAGWRVTVEDVSFDGRDPDLVLQGLSGSFVAGPSGWSFEQIAILTSRSTLAVSGRVDRAQPVATLDLDVRAEPIAFQEWAEVVPALRRLAVEAALTLRLQGPTDDLTTDLALQSDGGAVRAALAVNTTIPGWHAAGSASMSRFDLARWLDDPGHASRITGDVDMDLDLNLGRGVPQGTFVFAGPEARYFGYEGTDISVRGTLTASEVEIGTGEAAAYGAAVRIASGRIGFDDPHPFLFRGTVSGLDLRRLPGAVPVPHVSTRLALNFDVSGRFDSPQIAGHATFGPSTFLGARLSEGATGSIDTTASSVVYGGNGEISGLSLERLAADLEITWLDDPRYRGTVSGRFHARGAGSDPATMTLTGGGRLSEAALPGGVLSDADVALSIANGTLAMTYTGAFAGIDAAAVTGDERFPSSVSGMGRLDIVLPAFFERSPTLSGTTLDADLTLGAGTIRGIAIDSAVLRASLARGTLEIHQGTVAGPALAADASGTLVLREEGNGALSYSVSRADLAVLSAAFGGELVGVAAAEGQVTGSWSRLRVAGRADIGGFETAGVRTLSAEAQYDASFAPADPDRIAGSVDGRATLLEAFGEQFDEVAGTVTYDAGGVQADLAFVRPDLSGRISGSAHLPGGRRVDLSELQLEAQGSAWLLAGTDRPATITWDAEGVSVTPLEFVHAADDTQRVLLTGTWREDGAGALHVATSAVAIEALPGLGGEASPYAGLLTIDAVLTGTRERPIVTGHLLVVNGRVRDLTYEQFSGRVEYVGGMFEVGVRLDQSPGVWLTASGAVPLGLIDRTQPERPMYLAIASTPISLGLIEGLTGIVRDVSGQAELNVTAVGTSHEPRFTGVVALSNAGFVVTSTGARYQDGNGIIDLTADRITVRDFRIADSGGRVLDVSGSVGASDLKLQDLALEIAARGFEILRNEYGTINADARVAFRGRVESPEVSGTITITGGQLRADRILDRVLFQPYGLEEADGSSRPVDAIAALNPWDRLSLDVSVDVPGTLRLTGDNVQVASGTPLGVGNIDLRVAGAVHLRKGPGETLSVTGALDQITGRYAFQGRRFDLDPSSSITFRGDLEPDLQVTVHRLISGVDVRVAISGALSDPALELTSAPPLDSSDILSLIVFNTTANQLSVAQQEQLAVRAGTLAAGFLAAPLVTALERSLGIDLLEIEAADTGGARVTIGDEIAPGLVARFSRQFGSDEYDEATLEYYLSRLFRIRATFSDAGSAIRSPFRRVERAGVDLLLFFSF